MNSNSKNIMLGVLAVGVIAMTVAFAALSTNLRINGTASVPNVSWNIHFQNWQLDTENTVTVGGVTHQNTAEYPTVNELTQTISVANSTRVDGLNVSLYQPGDYVKYKFQIINEGTIDAELDNFSHNLTCASGNDCSHMSYEVLCNDAVSGGNNVLVAHSKLPKNGGLAYCTLEVKYNDYTNDNTSGNNQIYEKSAASATLDATFIYVQDTDSNSQSGENEQGNSGGNEPVAQWNNFYHYDEPSNRTYQTAALDSSWSTWARENTSTGDKEVCVHSSTGEKCMKYYTPAELSELITCNPQNKCTASGDLGERLQAIKDLGATCSLTSSGYYCNVGQLFWSLSSSMLYCGDNSQWRYCLINSDGSISCG